MKKRSSVNWGKWLREPKQDRWIIEEMQRVSKLSKFWASAAVIVIVLSVSTGLLLNHLAGLKTSAKIDASTRQMLDINKEFIQQSLNAMNPNDFIFKPFEDSEWYVPTPVNDYVKLNILPVPSKKITLNFSIKNKSEFPARDVYCMIFFSSKEFVETGDDVVKKLKGLGGLNVYTVNSPDDYLNEAAAFEWLSIPPKTQKTVTRNVDLTMRGNTGRLTFKINSVNRLAFEFRLQETKEE
ncbi:MAG: hypothetical protein JSW26_01370 [Desulfobacterales bacterium]|nr:MAG: hypothetical protein JSW26_01370 [Desulfobacterales bacterium]